MNKQVNRVAKCLRLRTNIKNVASLIIPGFLLFIMTGCVDNIFPSSKELIVFNETIGFPKQHLNKIYRWLDNYEESKMISEIVINYDKGHYTFLFTYGTTLDENELGKPTAEDKKWLGLMSDSLFECTSKPCYVTKSGGVSHSPSKLHHGYLAIALGYFDFVPSRVPKTENIYVFSTSSFKGQEVGLKENILCSTPLLNKKGDIFFILKVEQDFIGIWPFEGNDKELIKYFGETKAINIASIEPNKLKQYLNEYALLHTLRMKPAVSFTKTSDSSKSVRNFTKKIMTAQDTCEQNKKKCEEISKKKQ